MEHYEPRPNLLTNRVILVTGAADSIGYAVAADCARHGATVILSDKEQQDLEPLYDRIDGAGGPEPAILALDLEPADEQAFLGAADIVGREFGRLDGLVHCAAFAPFLSRIDDYDVAEWRRVLRVNLTAPFLLTQVCLPLLRAAPDASVVFTSDRVGRKGMAYWGAFGAAKFGIEGLMQTLADETRGSSAIRVNSIDPGIVRTGLRTRLYPGEDPSGLPPAETVTPLYLYLLGPDSRGITGEAFSAGGSR
ncbi:MAG: SDR family NAD(P)-dependent oxidoreductase [Pseudomonadota bacterium]|nr:SDR family NAD(P)-dependent oxidoreductase [Pseudomonadota bacterium]